MFGAKLSWSRVTWSESPSSASPISQTTPTSPYTRSSSTKPALVVKKFYHHYAKSSPSLVDTSPKNQANRRRKMGQNQTKSADMDVSYSTGPDPTLFHDRPPHSAPILPNTPMRPLDPPHSAPLVPTLTDQSLSRIEYTPGPYSAVPKPHQWNPPTRPVPAHRSFSVKPKNLAKKLSQRREVKSASPPPALDNQMPPTTAKAFKTLGEDIRFFDNGVQNVDIKSSPSTSPWNPAQMPVSTSATMKAATFSAATQKRRLSLSERSTDLPLHPQQGPQSTQYPYSKPTHHRRTSSNSVKSARGSVKSAKRAEREWRAKVAGLANARESARSSYVEVRGPPPPKRSMSGTLNLHADGNLSAQVSAINNPTSSANPPHFDITPDRRRGDTPESESLVTPPSSNVAVVLGGPHAAYNTPVGAKSIVSNQSFETLGHYPNPAYSPGTPSNALPITLSPSGTPYTSTPASARTGVLGPSKPPTRSRSRRLSTGSQRERLPVSGAPSVSSFYFNPQRASTRPSSLAVSHLLATIPSGDASSLAANNAPADSAQVPGDTAGTGLLVNKPTPPSPTTAGGAQAPHRASLPPFQSFQSPTSSSNPLKAGGEQQIEVKLAPRRGSRERRIASEPNIQIDPPSARTDHVKRSSLDSHAPRHDTPKDIASVAMAAVPANSALQPVKNSQKPSLPPTAQAVGSVHHARPAHPAILSVGVATPQRTSNIHLRAPATPLSPTTNFLLTAPIESLDWTQHLDSARSPKRDHHPFSSGEQPDFDVGGVVPQSKVDEWSRGCDHGDYDDYDRANPSFDQVPSTPHGLKDNRPITHSAKQFVYTDTGDNDRSFTFSSPPQMGLRTDVLRAQVNRTTYDPFSHPSSNASTTTTPPPLISASNPHGNVLHKPRAAKVNEREREKERRPSVLQVRKAQPKANIIGTGAQAGSREREREFEKYQRMGIDLTPGMQDGNRPAKSGLPVSDLEKWLKQTSLA